MIFVDRNLDEVLEPQIQVMIRPGEKLGRHARTPR